MKNLLNLIYITKAAAIAGGLTHEGTLFGVPAWFAGEGDEIAMATPKAPILHLWCRFADFAFEIASHFTPADRVLVSPIHVTHRIA
jgi:hypothetical protein